MSGITDDSTVGLSCMTDVGFFAGGLGIELEQRITGGLEFWSIWR